MRAELVVFFKYHSQPPAVIRILDVINKLAAATLLINAVDYTLPSEIVCGQSSLQIIMLR